jgi:hypothetical protein
MQSYVRRVVTRLAEADVLTHMLPYETRLSARRTASR